MSCTEWSWSYDSRKERPQAAPDQEPCRPQAAYQARNRAGGNGAPIDAFEVYNDFDRNLVNLFRCMKERTMATIRELGFCNLNSREDFIAIRKFFDHETFDDRFLTEELMLTEIMLPPPEAAELKEIRLRITEDHDVRRAAMFLKLLRNSYSSSGKSFASQPFDIRKLFGLIQELEDRMANVVIENQDFETLIRHYDRPDAFFYSEQIGGYLCFTLEGNGQFAAVPTEPAVWWIWALAGLGCAGAAGVILLLVRRRKRKPVNTQ